MNMRELINLFDAAEASYQKLADAGEEFDPGQNEVWYSKPEQKKQFSQGYEYLKQRKMLPTAQTLDRTHVLIGTLSEKDPKRILTMMQNEYWNPTNQAQDLLNSLDVDHASMQAGDIIVVDGKLHLVEPDGEILAIGDSK